MTRSWRLRNGCNRLDHVTEEVSSCYSAHLLDPYHLPNLGMARSLAKALAQSRSKFRRQVIRGPSQRLRQVIERSECLERPRDAVTHSPSHTTAVSALLDCGFVVEGFGRRESCDPSLSLFPLRATPTGCVHHQTRFSPLHLVSFPHHHSAHGGWPVVPCGCAHFRFSRIMLHIYSRPGCY